jgi:predicted DNA-binding transcriptional regulator YafY
VDDESHRALQIRIGRINEAIAKGCDIGFRYRKRDGTVTKRTVTPREIRKLSIAELQALIGRYGSIQKEGRLCMFGYCHLRTSDRTFAVDRIRDLRLLA